MKTLKYITVFILLINSILVLSQNIPQEVKQEISKNPANAGNIYLSYAKEYEKQNKFDASIACYKAAEELYKKANQEEGIAYINNKLGKVYAKSNKSKNAINSYKKAYEIYSKLNKTKSAYNAAYNLGDIYFQSKQYKKAVNYYLKAYNLIKNTNDYGEQAYILNQIASAYSNYGDYTNGLKYFKKTLAVANKTNNTDLIASVQNNIKAIEGNKENHQKLKTAFEKEQEQKQKEIVENLSKEYNDIKNKHLLSLKEIEKLSWENQAKELKLHVIKEKYEKQMLENQMKEQKIKLLKSENELKEKKVKLLEAENKIKELKINNQHKIITIISISLVIVVLLLIFIVILLIQRTKTLKLIKEKNLIIDEKNAVLSQANEEIAAQRDELEEQKEILNKQNKEITDSIKYAQRIQKSILPAHSQISNTINEFFIIYKPKNIVSGDFYWYAKQGENIWVAAVDCTGHGVPGAFMSMIGNSLLNKIIHENKDATPAKVLSLLNKELNYALNQNSDEETSDDGMDMTIINYNKPSNKLTIALANHTAILVNPDNTTSIIEGDIYSIGGLFAELDDVEYSDKNIEVNKGMSLYMFSDGYQDQFGGNENKKYTQERLVEKISEINSKPMDEQGKILEEEFEEWKGINEQLDDVMIIGIKF